MMRNRRGNDHRLGPARTYTDVWFLWKRSALYCILSPQADSIYEGRTRTSGSFGRDLHYIVFYDRKRTASMCGLIAREPCLQPARPRQRYREKTRHSTLRLLLLLLLL